MSDSEKGYAESQLEHRPAHPGHGTIGGNLSQQLKTWHANREDRSILLSIPPWPTRTRAHDLPANPFMILRNMSLLCYASFFTGFLCWFCDGLDYFSVSAQRYQKSSVSPRPPCLHCHGASAPSCDLCLGAFHSSRGGALERRVGARFAFPLPLETRRGLHLASIAFKLRRITPPMPPLMTSR